MSILLQETLYAILILSGIPLIASAFTGLIVAVLQTVTQIQEQTITYVVKVLTLLFVVVVCAQSGTSLLEEFSVRMYESVAVIGK